MVGSQVSLHWATYITPSPKAKLYIAILGQDVSLYPFIIFAGWQPVRFSSSQLISDLLDIKWFVVNASIRKT